MPIEELLKRYAGYGGDNCESDVAATKKNLRSSSRHRGFFLFLFFFCPFFALTIRIHPVSKLGRPSFHFDVVLAFRLRFDEKYLATDVRRRFTGFA